MIILIIHQCMTYNTFCELPGCMYILLTTHDKLSYDNVVSQKSEESSDTDKIMIVTMTDQED